MRLIALAVLLLWAPALTWATALRNFENTFSIERTSDGKIKQITLKKLPKTAVRFTETDYWREFVDELISSQEEIRLDDGNNFVETNLALAEFPNQYRKDQDAVLKVLKGKPIAPVLNDAKVKSALDLLAKDAESSDFNFRIIAVPYNPKYFDSHEKALKILVKASGIITLAGGSYGVSAALFLVQSAFDMILERRTYFQNYFVYHIHKYGPEKFGLTKEEAELILSSIYESRIKWWDIWERKKARNNWSRYGMMRYQEQLYEAEKRRKYDANEFGFTDDPVGFAFHGGVTAGFKRIMNLVTPRSLLSKKPSDGFEYQSPNRIRSYRMFYYLSQLAARLSPVPVVSGAYDFFVESLYVPQRQMEGSLYGYYCDMKSADEAEILVRQSINPFIIAEIED
jgi:hypothetical protein